MGRIAERIGVRWTVMFGAVMIARRAGAVDLGPSWPLYIGHGLFIGLIGIGGINAPCYVYVSRWFDRRRGSALALISSGAYLAGAIWPPIFARAIAYAGWRHTMLYYAAFELLLIVPAAAVCLAAAARDAPSRACRRAAAHRQKSVMGWPPNLVFALQMCAIFTCCVPMSMPQGASRGVLHRSRHQRRAWRGDGVGSARRGVLQPAGLGSDLRSDRRAVHHAGRIGLSGARHARHFY